MKTLRSGVAGIIFLTLFFHLKNVHAQEMKGVFDRLRTVKGRLCSHEASAQRGLRAVKQLLDVAREGRGLGIEVDGNISSGAGARIFGTFEFLVFNNRLTLACSYGAGGTVGAHAGVAASLVGIQAFGCRRASDYKGLFLSGGLTGSVAPVEVGAGVHLGISISMGRLDQMIRELGSIYQEFSMPGNVRTLLIEIARELINGHLEKQRRIYIDTHSPALLKRFLPIYLEARFRNTTTRELAADFLNALEQDYRRTQRRDTLLRMVLLRHLRSSFSGCNSITVEVGLAAKEGLSAAGTMSNYNIVDSSMEATGVLDKTADLASLLLDGVCHDRLSARRVWDATTDMDQVWAAKDLLLNLAKMPFTCSPLSQINSDIFD